MSEMKTYYATKPFWWDGKNIPVGGPVKINSVTAREMLHRGGISETEPGTIKAATAAKKGGAAKTKGWLTRPDLKMKTYYATKPFWWDGKNIPVGGPVKINSVPAGELLQRGAISKTKLGTIKAATAAKKGGAAKTRDRPPQSDRDMKTYYATKPFWWDGKNIETGKPVNLCEEDANLMLGIGAVTADKPTAKKAAQDS